jgi:small GTP-binding protein
MPGVAHFKAKIVLMGDGSVGKTSLIRRFVIDEFSDDYIETFGAKVTKKDVHIKQGPVERVRMSLMIWDVMGQLLERRGRGRAAGPGGPSNTFFRGAKGALAVCDLTNTDSLMNLRSWIDELQGVAGAVPVVLLGNKSDLANRRQVDPAELDDLAGELGLTAMTTSARTGENVQRAFIRISRLIHRRWHRPRR